MVTAVVAAAVLPVMEAVVGIQRPPLGRSLWPGDRLEGLPAAPLGSFGRQRLHPEGCRPPEKVCGPASRAMMGVRLHRSCSLGCLVVPGGRPQCAAQPFSLELLGPARASRIRGGSTSGGDPPPPLGLTPCTRLKSPPKAPQSEGEWSPCQAQHRPDLVPGLRRMPHTGHDRWHAGSRSMLHAGSTTSPWASTTAATSSSPNPPYDSPSKVAA